MSISPVTTNYSTCDASYIKYQQQRKRNAGLLLIGSGTLGVSAAVLHFTKSPIAKNHPWLLATGAALSLLGTVIGTSGLTSATKEIKKAASNQDCEKNNDAEVERSKQAINHMINSNPMLNPTGYISHAANPALDTQPTDSSSIFNLK